VPVRRLGGEPPAAREGLAFAQLTQRHINVPMIALDPSEPGGIRCIAGDIANALHVTNHPQPLRPPLVHRGRFLQTRLTSSNSTIDAEFLAMVDPWEISYRLSSKLGPEDSPETVCGV
jgi:hypothetical protein